MNSLIPLLLIAFPDTAQVVPPPAPIVQVWCIHGCEPCHRMKLNTRGYCDLDFRYESTLSKQPKWVRDRVKTGQLGYPIIEWKTANGKAYYAEGWKDLPTFLKIREGTIKHDPHVPPIGPLLPSVPPPIPSSAGIAPTTISPPEIKP